MGVPSDPFHGRFAAAALTLAAGIACGLGEPAGAVTRFQRSVFSAVSLANCEDLPAPAGGGSAYLCPGLPGYPVYYAETRDHAFLGLGSAPQSSKAAAQSLAAPNSLRPHAGKRITIEWRVVIRDGRNVPYAAIVRAFTGGKGDKGQVLIVFKIAGPEACHAGYADALANAQPIVLAHTYADEDARSFDCAMAPRVLGESGRSPM